MPNGNAGFSIPGIYQPNILERVGALLQGQQDPIHKAQALDIEQKLGMMRLQQGQEELGIKKEESSRKRVNDILDFITKFDVPEEVATKMVRDLIKHDPTAQSYFKGIDPEEISVAPKTKGMTIEREFKEGELPDPSQPGQFMAAGRYKVEGRPGKWTSILPVRKEGIGTPTTLADANLLFPDQQIASLKDLSPQQRELLNAYSGEKEAAVKTQMTRLIAEHRRGGKSIEEIDVPKLIESAVNAGEARLTARAKAGAEVKVGVAESRPPRLPAGSAIVDKATGEIFDPAGFTQQEFNARKNELKIINPSQREQIGYIENLAKPAIAQMRELVPKLAVKAKGANLANWLAVEARKGIGIDPDVAQYMDLRTKLTVEQTRILGGGARMLFGLFQRLESTTLPQLRQTFDVQMRLLDNDAWEFDNRVRSLKGMAPLTFKEWKTDNPTPLSPEEEAQNFLKKQKAQK